MNTGMDRLKEICFSCLKEKNQSEERLKNEFVEIESQNMANYFLDLHDKKIKYPYNQNNLLVPCLLGIVDDFDGNKPSNFVYGDVPDIDVDYLPIIRDYLKYDWAHIAFGEEKICHIGTYNQYGIKSALIDMARVHGLDDKEIKAITTTIKDKEKDEEGKVTAITWSRAIETYPALKEYCEKNPNVAKAAQKLLHKNRSGGSHAGGLIISSVPLADFVPLEKRKDGTIVSAWTEGLNRTDLGPVGLVKFDLLVITNILQIAYACHLIKQRHNLSSICALSNQPDWSDISYLNDPKPLKMASLGDLKGVFQFDSDGIRKLAKQGGVDSFDDLVAYTALYRPSVLSIKMHEHYIDRKKGKEQYEIHDVLKPYLNTTYGILCYQEQVNQVLHVIGDIPLKDCEIIRKAISKKKEKDFAEYKDQFIERGQVNLKWDKEKVEELWKQIEMFAGYGFNLCMAYGTNIIVVENEGFVEKEIQNFVPGDKVLSVDINGNTVVSEVVQLHDHGEIEGYEITFDDGHSLICSMDHKFLTEYGQKSLREIIGNNLDILCDDTIINYVKEKKGRLVDSMRNDCSDQTEVCSSPKDMFRVSIENIYNRQVGISLRADIQNKEAIEKSSTKVQGMPQVGMENQEWKVSCSGGTLRNYFDDIPFISRTSIELFKVRRYQKKKYYKKEPSGQSIRWAQKGFFNGCQNNFISARNSESKSREIAIVERNEPRKVCFVYKSINQKFKKIKDGKLASRTIKMGKFSSALQEQKTEICRFSKGENLDRSGWILSFFRELSQQKFKGLSPTFCFSKSGCYAQSGSDTSRKCDAFKVEYGMFCKFHRSHEIGMVEMASGYAPICDTRRLVCRKIIRVVPVGRRQMYDLEVSNPTHNFILPNGVVTSNSHSVAYTYISSRLLWLKCHYPLEFYTSILRFEDDVEKIKEYMIDARKHNININPVDINNSKVKFDIVGDDIYYGFSHIKGIGDEISGKIVEGQPYASFKDFMDKGNLDASVIKPLIGLRVFKDKEPIELFKFYEAYKKEKISKKASETRYRLSVKKYIEELRNLLPDDLKEYAGFSEESLSKLTIWINENKRTFDKIHNKFERSTNIYSAKQNEEELDLDKIKIDSKLIETYSDIFKSETSYYGFLWKHPLEDSPDYYGDMTFDKLKAEAEIEAQSNKVLVAPVEMMIREVKKKTSSNGKVNYWTVVGEDVNSDIGYITFWEQDFLRWQNELIKGNLVRIRLKAPSGGYSSYTFDSPQKHLRYMLPKNKKDDCRLILLDMPKVKKHE